ncbi:MAG: tRNA uridine-5-carboxymethylaminomethyl(34) synthesis GTPase MnmE [Calditrichia bacterium]
MSDYLNNGDTIIALSTPLGNGAIAVIRIGGPDALAVFNPFLKQPIREEDARKAIFNEIVTQDKTTIDQVITTWFRAPASYTGEDLLEISCHCNPLIIDSIIDLAISNGARVAAPGEFTFRAFLNGKLNLAQAEAVSDLINSRSRQSLTQSMRHLEGRLSERISTIRERILNLLSLLEVSLDFSEDEIELIPMPELINRIETTIAEIQQFLRTYDYGRLLQEGIKLLILGKPNVGKSSLLNALLQRDRAIVSDIPGTTRDYIEANLELDGLAVQAVDTAGIRDTEDTVEAIGVERALNQLQTADIALCVFDGNAPLSSDDTVLIDLISEHQKDVSFILIANKSDLLQNEQTIQTLEALTSPLCSLSAVTSSGIDTLKQDIKRSLISDVSLESEEVVITSARHKAALDKTIESLVHSVQSIQAGASEEIIAIDMRLALDHIGEITGETSSEDVLNHIFSSFCIGK